MKLQVLIHGINVVEDVLNNSGNDSHHFWVMEFPLYETSMEKIEIKQLGISITEACAECTSCKLPPSCVFCQRMSVHRQILSRCIHPEHLYMARQKENTLALVLSGF